MAITLKITVELKMEDKSGFELMTRKEVMEALRLKKSRFHELLNQGKIPQPVRLAGRRALYRRSEVVILLQGGKYSGEAGH